MTRGELERASRHYEQWRALRNMRRMIADRGFMLVPGTLDDDAPPVILPSDHPLTRAILKEIDNGIDNHAALLTTLGIDMLDEAPAA